MKTLHLVLLGAAGIGGFLLYRKLVGAQAGSTSQSPYSNPQQGSNLQLMSQPSNLYPVRPIVPPRVDNSSQPWYAGDRSFNLNSPDSFFGGDFNSIVSDFKSLGDLSSSLSELYDNLGIASWFSDSDDAGAGFDASSYDMSFQGYLAYA